LDDISSGRIAIAGHCATAVIAFKEVRAKDFPAGPSKGTTFNVTGTSEFYFDDEKNCEDK